MDVISGVGNKNELLLMFRDGDPTTVLQNANIYGRVAYRLMVMHVALAAGIGVSQAVESRCIVRCYVESSCIVRCYVILVID